MNRLIVRLRACGEPYSFEELQDLKQALARAYEVRLEEEGEGGGLFGLDLLVMIPALLTSPPAVAVGLAAKAVVQPFVQGAVQELGKNFALLLLKHLPDARRQLSENDGSDITLQISSLCPAGYRSDYVHRTFGIRAAVRVRGDDLKRPGELLSRTDAACDMIVEAFSQLWKAAEEGQVPVPLELAHFDHNPPNQFRIVRVSGDLSLSSPEYEGDLFAPGPLTWHRIDPDGASSCAIP